jgi:hypothetical protein
VSIPRRRIPPTERFAAVVAGVVLLALTALFVLLAIDFVAAATGSDFSPWGAFPVPDALGQRVAILAGLAVVGVLLMIAGLRLREPLLRVDVPHGRVTVRAHAIELELEAAMAADPDVLETEASVRSKNGELVADLGIVARPDADVDRIKRAAAARLQEKLCEAAGLTCPLPRISVQCVGVRELSRYLA